MPLPLKTVFTQLQAASQYILNSDYDVVWQGTLASPLNAYNQYVEQINIPGRTINVSESRTSNSVPAKIAGEVGYEDLEVTWRLTGDLGIYTAIQNWMNAAKNISPTGSVKTGFFSDYCQSQTCRIGILPPQQFSTSGNQSVNAQLKTIATIQGLYPTNLQTISFSSEGGDYIKIAVTFSCYKVINGDITGAGAGSI